MGISHEWNGTVLTITSDSGTSSADLKGEKGDTGIRGAQGIKGNTGMINYELLEDYPTKEEVTVQIAEAQLPEKDVDLSGYYARNEANSIFANILKGSKSGEAVVANDISPITHDMSVKVRGKNLFDEKQITGCIDGDSEVEYSRYGEVIDGCLVSKLATYDRGTMWNGFKIYLEKNETYTLSADAYFGTNKEGTKRVTVGFIMKNSDGTLKDFTNLVTLSTWDKWEHITTQLNVTESGYYYLRLQATGGAAQYTDMDARFKNIQVEIGTNATAYTPYVPDLTAVKVSRCGKNLFDKSIPYEDYTSHGGGYRLLSIYVGSGSTVTVSLKQKHDIGLGGYFYCIAYKSGVPGASQKWLYSTDNTSLCAKSVTMISEDGYISLIMTSDAYNSFKDEIMVEIGSTATDYEPYKECEDYTPNADGTVNGVTAIYPTTTITTDTTGIVVDMEYNRDINKAFAELQQAIISLGGNV